ncbi:MAG TPA: hypothetical protein VF311_07700 [Terriglobales bacterium]|jgi:hypothetical protein
MLFICVLSLGQFFPLQAQESAVRQEARMDAHIVRIVYLVPSDRLFRSEYRRRIKAAIFNVQMWYRGQMGNGETFRLPHPVVKVVHTSHAAAWYETNPVTGADARLWFWFNALADAFSATGAQFYDPNHRWVFYIDADPGCGQVIGSAASVALLGANDLRGLTGQPNIPACSWEPPDTGGVCRWVGGLGHELGHTFGLPHPVPCPGGSADDALMCVGYITYPDTYLLPEDKEILEASLFFWPLRPKTKAGKPICDLSAAQ